MKRREALKSTILGTSAAVLSTGFKNIEQLLMSNVDKNDINLGVQLFTVPQMTVKDLRGTLQTVSEIGYKEVEFFGPFPASSEAAKKQYREMFGPMFGAKDHAFFGFSPDETVGMLKEYNLSAPSLHVDISTLRNNLGQIAEMGNKLGTKYLIIAAIMQGRDTLDGYKRLAEEFNGFGEGLSKYGMKFAYHNHGYEHVVMDGQVPMDYLIQNTNPDYVQFELDVFWMSAAGANPLEYLDKYPNRYKLLHLKDSKEKIQFSGTGSNPQEWRELFGYMTDPGDGVFEISKIIEKASKIGVDHYYLERDMAPDPMATLNNSFKNLSGMI
ncbi:MAG: sugar phosphate isomerase/epimerase [Maribacter sp.]|nr:sugar phosphate isomerase/epimerase [Maribacter sp.]